MAADAPAQKSKALDTNATLSSFFIIILGLGAKALLTYSYTKAGWKLDAGK
jgi:hypothetical protein